MALSSASAVAKTEAEEATQRWLPKELARLPDLDSRP